MSRFHCCATCQHFSVVKQPHGTTYQCVRLGYHTKPNYRFQCWNPKDNVRKLMKEEEPR